MGASSPVAGVGIGWRTEIAGYVKDLPQLKFVEVVTESVTDRSLAQLDELRTAGMTVIPHGTRLSLGSAEPVDPQRLQHFVATADRLDAPIASEHIAFVRALGLEAGHLLPLPRTWEAVDAMVANTRLVQAELGCPLALEPIAAIFDWPDDELTEAQFIYEILDRTGAALLLDVANVYANARNRGTAATELLDHLPLEKIAYLHVAGGSAQGGFYHDTHTDPIPDQVIDLLAELRARVEIPAVMLERDGHYPPAAELTAELDRIATAARLPSVSR